MAHWLQDIEQVRVIHWIGLLTPAGIYTVEAILCDEWCRRAMAGSTTVSITPLAPPTVDIGTVRATASVRINSTTDQYQRMGGTSPSYLWKVNGVSVSTDKTPTAMYQPMET